MNQILLRRIFFQFERRSSRFALDFAIHWNPTLETFLGHHSPFRSLLSPSTVCCTRRTSASGHGERPDPLEHRFEQASRQETLGGASQLIPRVFRRPAHQS